MKVGLAGVYQVAGVGLRETRTLSTVAGILSCLLIYGFLRGRYSRGRALAGAAALGTSYFLLTNNRIGFTESLQLLFIVGAVIGVL